MSAEYQTSEDMTFEMALARLSGFIFTDTESQLRRMAQAIGLAYGMSPQDVLSLATMDAAVAIQHQRDALLAIYPQWAQGPGADV